MGLKHSYTLFAPLYDPLVQRATLSARARSLSRLQGFEGRLLVPGFGTGLDIDFLPTQAHISALDLTPAMLDRAKARAAQTKLDINWHVGDAQALPFDDQQFDAVLMHLILAVVPQPELALQEASRVLKRGGRLLILDKFLRQGSWSPIRRLLSPVIGQIATRTNVVFEDLLVHTPELHVQEDSSAGLGGWFRQIEATKSL
ncbi:MAG: class I SAM-dependent methyltransferase [Granulosicoccaceae bacterium]